MRKIPELDTEDPEQIIYLSTEDLVEFQCLIYHSIALKVLYNFVFGWNKMRFAAEPHIRENWPGELCVFCSNFGRDFPDNKILWLHFTQKIFDRAFKELSIGVCFNKICQKWTELFNFYQHQLFVIFSLRVEMLAQNNRISCFYCTAKCQCKGTMFTKLSTGYWKAPRTIKLQIQRPAGGCRLAKRHAVTSANFVLIFSSPQSCSIIHLHIFFKKILRSAEWKDKFSLAKISSPEQILTIQLHLHKQVYR